MENQSSFSDDEASQSEEEVGYEETEMNIDQQEDDELSEFDEGGNSSFVISSNIVTYAYS